MLRDVRFLKMGHCLIDQSQLVTGEPVGHVVRIPIWAYLLRGTDSLLLVDSGMPDGCVGNEGYFGETDPGDIILPQMGPDETVDRVLARHSLAIQDLDALITTHWHFDHAGGMRRFRDRPILVHPAEVEAARAEAQLPEWIDLTLAFAPVTDGFQPMPGVRLVHTPGHTPGHTSLYLEPQGLPPIVLTIDAVYTRQNWQRDVSGAMLDAAVGQASVARLRGIARDAGAAVFFGHDPAQAEEDFWRTFVP
jgi:N-acyl homoserine lactone hydrolase